MAMSGLRGLLVRLLPAFALAVAALPAFAHSAEDVETAAESTELAQNFGWPKPPPGAWSDQGWRTQPTPPHRYARLQAGPARPAGPPPGWHPAQYGNRHAGYRAPWPVMVPGPAPMPPAYRSPAYRPVPGPWAGEAMPPPYPAMIRRDAPRPPPDAYYGPQPPPGFYPPPSGYARYQGPPPGFYPPPSYPMGFARGPGPSYPMAPGLRPSPWSGQPFATIAPPPRFWPPLASDTVQSAPSPRSAAFARGGPSELPSIGSGSVWRVKPAAPAGATFADAEPGAPGGAGFACCDADEPGPGGHIPPPPGPYPDW